MVYFVIALFAFFISKPMDDNMGLAAVKFVPMLVLTLGIVMYSFRKKGHLFIGKVVNRKQMAWYMGFILIYVISIFRKFEADVFSIGTFNQSFQVIFLALYAYIFFSYLLRQPGLHEENFTKVILMLLIAPGLFIILNGTTYMLGITTPMDFKYEGGEHEYSVLASLIGLTIKRTGFMFTGHPNNFAPVVGLLIVLSVLALYSLNLSKLMKWFLYISVFCCVFCLILVDSRGTFISTIVTITMILTLVKINKVGILKTVVLIMPLIPFFITAILGWVAQTDIASGMSRDATELATANGRVYIWRECIDFIFNPDIQHIFGYGQVGHFGSGVVHKWAWVLPGFVSHNFFFQVFLDQGYVGIILMVGLLYITMKNAIFLYRRGHKSMLIFMAFPIFFLFTGMFESIFGVYNQFYSTMYILITICPILFKNAWLKGQEGHVQVPLVTITQSSKYL